MNKFAPIALLVTVATLAVVPAAVFAAEASQQVREAADASVAANALAVNAGKMIYDTDGKRIAPIYRVTASGDVQIILSARLVTIPAASLSDVNGKVTTSIDKSALNRR